MSARRGWSWSYCVILFVSFFLRTSSALLIHHCRGLLHIASSPCLHAKFDDEEEESYDYDEDEYTVKPYRNRSLAWTLRYRKLNPYDIARARVINFGHRSKEDWDDAVSSGQLGQYVPSYPDEMYAPEWVSWEEWLGLMRSYSDTKNLATNILGLKSLDDYLIFVKSNSKRAEGLRIPVRPDIYYKDDWIDEESFFGRS